MPGGGRGANGPDPPRQRRATPYGLSIVLCPPGSVATSPAAERAFVIHDGKTKARDVAGTARNPS